MKLQHIFALLLILPAFTSAKEMKVFDPPSNIRDKPDGEILCQITEKKSIEIFGEKDDWVFTDACGVSGVIHKSQLKELAQSDDSSSEPPASVPEPSPAPAPARSTACDHVYVGKEFDSKLGMYWLKFHWRVQGVNPNTGRATVRTNEIDSGKSEEVSCGSIP